MAEICKAAGKDINALASYLTRLVNQLSSFYLNISHSAARLQAREVSRTGAARLSDVWDVLAHVVEGLLKWRPPGPQHLNHM